jgi:aryl carrier-like protein
MRTNYKEIYLNLISEKFPKKLEDPKVMWKLEHLDSALNIIELNDLLFHNGKREINITDSRLRSYTQDEIIRILKYQEQYKKSNTDIINKYGMTRATLNTWRKRFQNQLFTPIL